ncbi:MAG TPA: hypothetical protein VF933_00755 [Streptosporangiaceae bacterium]
MIDSPSYSGTGAVSGDETHALFGQTMGGDSHPPAGDATSL